jgi:hypothetical protein
MYAVRGLVTPRPAKAGTADPALKGLLMQSRADRRLLDMSKPMQHEALKIVEIELGPEDDLGPEDEESAQEAAHTESRAITDMMRREKMTMPIQVASLAVNAEGCLYRYDEYSEGILLCTTRIGEKMGGFPVHYLLVDSKGKTARLIVRGRRGS